MQKATLSYQANGLQREQTMSAQQAFETQFHEQWPRVYGLLLRMIGDPAEAQDLALEAFWRLYQHTCQPEQRRSDQPAGWLYRVALNLGYNALRAVNRRERYEQQASESHWDRQVAWDPAQEFEKSQERALVRQVLSRIRPRSARLLLLRYSGLTYQEIAMVLDVLPGSVGTILARAEQEFERAYRKLEREPGHLGE